MVEYPKNRLLTIFLHIMLWGLIALVLYLATYEHKSIEDDIRFVKTMFMIAAAFYLNFYFFISRFLSKKKFKVYAFFIVGILAANFAISYFSELPFDIKQLDDGDRPVHFTSAEHSGPSNPMTISLGILVLSIVSVAVSTGIRSTREWFKSEKQVKELEDRNLLAELSYLKAQINPHFFFNTLNGIYALARNKSDKTPEVIMMLSELMRYIIYETRAPKVQLEKELAHISHYIDLQKLRLSKMVKIDYEVYGNPTDIMIEPLLFSVFVENAFKHGIDYSKQNTIRIILNIKDNVLHFVVSNPIVRQKEDITKFDEEDAGIGVDNIKKRLELLYPNHHELTTFENQSLYTVELKLILDENNHEMYHN